MPFVDVKVLGTLTIEQKRELARRFTSALQEVAGKPPAYTHVVFHEIPDTSWANEGTLFADQE
jgi:4-oxalocrotonate tautomerase